MTAGLNVPADSQPVPCGDRIGALGDAFHLPKGIVYPRGINGTDQAQGQGKCAKARSTFGDSVMKTHADGF